MTLYPEKFRAESSRLRGWDYRARLVLRHHLRRSHAHIFGEVEEREVVLSLVGRIAEFELRTLCQHYDNVQIVEHVVMPNHVHAIVMIDGDHHFSPDPQMKLPCVNTSGLPRHKPTRYPRSFVRIRRE